MGDAAEDAKSDLRAALSVAQNGAKLSSALIDALLDHFVDTMKVSTVDEVASDDPNEMAQAAAEAWAASFTGEELPSALALRVRKWAGEVQASAAKSTKDTPLAGSNVGEVAMNDKLEAARLQTAGMGLNFQERDKAMKDMAAQGLNLDRLSAMSLCIHVGRWHTLSVCSKNMKYGEDPAYTELAKLNRKSHRDCLTTIVKSKNWNKLSNHFTNLMTKYSAECMVEESALIGSWWSETSGCFSSDRDSIFQYVEDYFDKYVGRGLPVTVDPVLISTIRQSTGGGAGASKEDHKTLKNRVNDLESVLTKLKTQVAEIEKKGGNNKKLTAEEQEERRKKVTCHNCGVKGHYESECPQPKKKESDEG